MLQLSVSGAEHNQMLLGKYAVPNGSDCADAGDDGYHQFCDTGTYDFSPCPAKQDMSKSIGNLLE
jgi:hypothetical protein